MTSGSASHLLWRAVVSLALGSGVLVLGLLGYGRLKALREAPTRAAGGAPLTVVRTVEVARAHHQEWLRGYGTLRALRTARVSAEVAGVVRAIHPSLEAGGLVAPPPRGTDGGAGDLPDAAALVTIDPRDFEDQLAGTRAEAAQVRADQERLEALFRDLDDQLRVADQRLSTARAEMKRIERLVPNTLPESDLDRQRLAVFALDQMRSEVEARRHEAEAQAKGVKARLDVLAIREREALRNLQRTHVHAPFAGRVVVRSVDVGTRVTPGTPLFDLVDVSRLEAAVALPAGRCGDVCAQAPGVPGSRIVIRLRAEDPPVWEGEVERIDPVIDEVSRTFRVYAVVPAGSAKAPLAPGAPVIADVEGRRYADVIAFPREAFLDGVIYVAEPEAQGEVAVARRLEPTIVATLPDVVLV
ncbi:MAG: efflux RND transporter periplasmic adaptor subunit, partial [Planctomycetota bacterium]